jgi:hypothetical protein
MDWLVAITKKIEEIMQNESELANTLNYMKK